MIPRLLAIFCNLFFYGEELLAPRPTTKLEDHPLSAVRNCLFNIFAATLRISRPFLHPQPEDAPCRADMDPLITERCNSTLSLTLALDEGGWSTSRPRPGTTGKQTRYPLYRRLGGPQGRSAQVQKTSPPLRFDPRTVQPVPSRCSDSEVPGQVKATLPERELDRRWALLQKYARVSALSLLDASPVNTKAFWRHIVIPSPA
jgi:hypothetical protein